MALLLLISYTITLHRKFAVLPVASRGRQLHLSNCLKATLLSAGRELGERSKHAAPLQVKKGCRKVKQAKWMTEHTHERERERSERLSLSLSLSKVKKRSGPVSYLMEKQKCISNEATIQQSM